MMATILAWGLLPFLYVCYEVGGLIHDKIKEKQK